MFNNSTAIDVIDNLCGGSPSTATNAYIRQALSQGAQATAWVRLVTWWADATESEQYSLGSIIGICEASHRNAADFMPAGLVRDARAIWAAVNGAEGLYVDFIM